MMAMVHHHRIQALTNYVDNNGKIANLNLTLFCQRSFSPQSVKTRAARATTRAARATSRAARATTRAARATTRATACTSPHV